MWALLIKLCTAKRTMGSAKFLIRPGLQLTQHQPPDRVITRDLIDIIPCFQAEFELEHIHSLDKGIGIGLILL